MPARKQKRRVAGRRKGKGDCEATPTQKANSRCEVCFKIAGVNLRARNIREGRNIKPDEAEYQYHIHETLGTLEDVLQRSMCNYHPEMIRKLFQNLGNEHELRNQEIRCGEFYNSPGLYISVGDFEKQPGDGHFIFGLVLVSSKNQIPNVHRGRLVDAKYIDASLIHRWRRSCDIKQHGACQNNPLQDLRSWAPPAYLIDTWSMCLIPGYANASYVALSYVWGKDPFFQTSRSTIEELQVKNAIRDLVIKLGLPRTISDALSVVQLLGERYLWVDALCIVQDDQEMKHDQIKDMVSIFANASITIMAHQGEDANYGLRGLRGISLPRQLSQERFKLENGDEMIQLHGLKRDYTWFQRGWTFQEGLFSRRKLTFNNDAIFWDCACNSSQEDLEPLPERQHLIINHDYPHFKDFNFISSIPSLSGYAEYVNVYNCRKLTFQEDAMAAFSGIISLASRSFQGGFVCGLPTLFFDTALCWQPTSIYGGRRYPSKKSNSEQVCLPSWSWIGWQCGLQAGCWNGACHYVKQSTSMHTCVTSMRTISTVQWYSRKPDTANLNPILGLQTVKTAKTLAQESDYVPGPGWERFQCLVDETQPELQLDVSWPDLVPPKYYFKHESDPETELWYPLPISEEQRHYPQTEDSILCCRTQKSKLYLAESIKPPELTFSLRKENGIWAGMLRPNIIPPRPLRGRKSELKMAGFTLCNLVSISEGYFLDGMNDILMNEYDVEERPKAADGAKYEFYNVLWVEWDEGIAYRKGCGRVAKQLWNSLNPEWCDLVLG